jgi:hypothetical protein
MPAHLREQPLSTVTSKQLRQWRDALAKTDLTAASVNKIAKSARAAFALAAKLDGRVAANVQAWTVGLEMLPNSVNSRDAVLADTHVTAIVAAAYTIDGQFGLFVQAHAETGSRSSQLARCGVADLVGDKLMVPASHKGRNGGKGGHVGVPLTPGLAARLRNAAAGQPPSEALFLQGNGRRWRDGDHRRPFAKAAAAAVVSNDLWQAHRPAPADRFWPRQLRRSARLDEPSARRARTHFAPHAQANPAGSRLFTLDNRLYQDTRATCWPARRTGRAAQYDSTRKSCFHQGLGSTHRSSEGDSAVAAPEDHRSVRRSRQQRRGSGRPSRASAPETPSCVHCLTQLASDQMEDL